MNKTEVLDCISSIESDVQNDYKELNCLLSRAMNKYGSDTVILDSLIQALQSTITTKYAIAKMLEEVYVYARP